MRRDGKTVLLYSWESNETAIYVAGVGRRGSGYQ